MTKVKILFLYLFLVISSLTAKEYRIYTLEDKVVVQDENDQIISHNISSVFNNLNSGDSVKFKRGDIFYQKVLVKNKSDIFIGSYGDVNLSLPVITSVREIPFEENQTFEIFYSKDKEVDLNDTSFQNLSYRFMQNYSLLSTQTKQQIANNFKDVKDFVDYIVRIKLPVEKFEYFDPKAVRIWIKDDEKLRLMLFEELRCKECKDSIRWFFEDKENYLYLFIRGETGNLDKLKDELKINNINVDTLSIQNSKNITVSNLSIEGGKYAVALRGSSFVNFTDCSVGKGAFVGVEITNSLDSNASSDYNILDGCSIDSGFDFKNYRFHSSRGVQDGIFLVGKASQNKIIGCSVTNWGHSAINLFSSEENGGNISFNEFISNRIDGSKVPYMHGFTTEGITCAHNRFTSNFFTNLGARNQFGGVENAVYRNYFGNIYNSQIKKDQGYGAGQGIWIQAYAKNNYITENIFINCDEAAISVVSYEKDSEKEKNTISGNFIINCGEKIFNKPYQNCVIEVFDKHKESSSIKDNNFVNNKIFARGYTPKIYYHDEEFTIDEFNKQIGRYGDFIIGNKQIGR